MPFFGVVVILAKHVGVKKQKIQNIRDVAFIVVRLVGVKAVSISMM